MKQPPLIDTAGPARSHLTRKMTKTEIERTFKVCQISGGSFMRALGTAGLAADPENVGKILRTWPQIEQVYGPESKLYKREKF